MQIKESELLEANDYRYSDLGYYFFKKLIESKYKKQLNNIVEEQFYKRLGMENLGYLPLGRIKPNRIIPTNPVIDWNESYERNF